MKIYFGQNTEEELIDGSFEYDGKYFEYVLELNSECITLRDTCNRIVPISIGQWFEFTHAIIKADLTVSPVAKAVKNINEINSDKESYIL